MFGLLQEPPTRRSCSSAISNDQDEIELPHHRNRYTPQPPTTARGTYPQNFNSPQVPLFSTTDGIFRFRGGYTRSLRESRSRSLRCRGWRCCLRKRGIRHRGGRTTGGQHRCIRCWRGGLMGITGRRTQRLKLSANELGTVVDPWGRSPNVDR